VAVERQKEKQKAPGELAADATKKAAEEEAAAERAEKPESKQAKSKATKAEKADAKPARARRPRKAATPKAESDDGGESAATETPKAPARRRARSRRPSPEPARTERRPVTSRPHVHAQAKYVRSSARKARLVIDHIRGKSVGEARAILSHAPRAVARDIEKLLASAVANAENNHELVGDDLYVHEAYANEGPTLKRFKPRAYGRATRIRKRTTHLTLTLTPKD
jgi:ribosomal protein L22